MNQRGNSPKSFFSYAVIVALLFLLCWPVSLILNVFWYIEARTLERESRQTPEGKGCLQVLLAVSTGILILVIVGLIAGWGREFWNAVNP